MDHMYFSDLLKSSLSGIEEIEAIIKNDDATWNILIGSELITLELDEIMARGYFTIEATENFGPVSRENLILMLQYSCLWHETNGAYFAMDENENPLLVFSVNLDGLNQNSIRTIIFNLSNKFNIWKNLL